MYLYICPVCGAYLDPGERCDCTEEREREEQERAERNLDIWKDLIREEDGQLRIAV